MSPNVLRRFIVIVGIATVVMFGVWTGTSYFSPPPGDYEVRKGDIHLRGGEWQAALADFTAALEEQPDHRGALMGRAIAYLQGGQAVEAEAEFTYLIDYLTDTLVEDDPTGRGTLAAAYANRGILRDRDGRHEAALEDYIESLRIDQGAVSGPNIFHKVLHDARPSTVRDRAQYLYDQFQLPADQRVLSVPELDARQRMHKP